MEYGQELDKIKKEVTNSGKKLEDLSKLMKNLSGLTKLQDSINNFQEDNVLNRIETKIDIIAQSDYSEIFNFSIESLKNDLTNNLELINSKINYIGTKINDESFSLENSLNAENAETSPDFSLLEDLSFVKENFYKINEKFSEITHLIRTNTAESEELNNRFENNITNFNSGFQNIYERFNNFDKTFKSNFNEFKTCIQDIYDQFSTIDNRSDIDQLRLYVQSFNNKLLSIAEILEALKENNFSLKIDNNETLIKEKSEEINRNIEYLLDETRNFTGKVAEEFSYLAKPLNSVVELSGSLKESVDKLNTKDDKEIKQQTQQLLDRFENIYKNAEANLEYIFDASKLFYEKTETLKNDFSNLAYETNSKVNDFISKAEVIELKIQNNLSGAESALETLKNVSKFAEAQININYENINLIKTVIFELTENFEAFKNDITDVNSKINKLILGEKENSNKIISCFEDFKKEINNNLETNIEVLNKTGEKIVKNISAEIKEINKKLAQAEELSLSTFETAKDVKNALVFMAEWFDSAGKLLEENNKNIKKNLIETEKTHSYIKRSEENVIDQIKRISDKLNRLEIRLENIEGKIEKLNDKNYDREISTLLSDILEKVELANERSKTNELIIDRLENLESRLKETENLNTTKNKKKISQEKA